MCSFGFRLSRSGVLIQALFAFFLLTGCGGPDFAGRSPFDRIYPDAAWERATPESQGIDSGLLLTMMEEIEDRQYDIDAVILARNGRIVFDAYRAPYQPEMLHRIYSCTKSINSLLVGMAVDNKAISGTGSAVRDLFSVPDTEAVERIPADLTLEHLLTMTTGLDARDSYRYSWAGLREIRESDDPVLFALTRPSIHPPGERFEYSNHASFLLGAAVSEAVGRPVNAWASDELFEPLGIGTHRWDALRGGEANTWGGLWMTGEDLARIGLLVARNGLWDGQQIVSRKWLKESLSPRVQGRDLNDFYGYQWWITTDGIPMAQGYAGQYLIILPEEDLVLVFLSSLPNREFHRPQMLLRDYVLPALEAGPLEENPAVLAELNRISEAWAIRYDSGISGSKEAASLPGSRYVLESNSRGITAVMFSRNRTGKLEYREEYGSRWIRYSVGEEGNFIVSQTDGLYYALACRWKEDGFDMREYGLGQAYRNDYRIRFPEEGRITISITDTSGNRSVLSGRAADDG